MVDRSVVVDPTNAAQLAAWDGDEGAFWAANADRFDRSIAGHHRRFMSAAAIAAGDVVLDVGCGTGQTTIEAAMSSAGGRALGVDLSEAMLEVARRRAADAGITTASFVRADAQVHFLGDIAADVVLGRTSAMFFGDHAAAFANLRASLRPGGRLVLLTWQALAGNEWLQVIASSLSPDRPPRLPPAGTGPLSLSEPARITTLLTGAGFVDVDVTPSVAPMHFGADADDAVGFILGLQGWMLQECDEDARRRAIETLHEACEAHESGDGVEFASATWITTAHV